MRAKAAVSIGIGLIVLGLGGCQGTTGLFPNLFAGEPVISDNVWLLQKDPPKDLGEQYLPPTCVGKAESTDTTEIKACTLALKQLIDVRFGHYSDSLMGAVNGGNTILDVANLGFNATGALAGGTTSQIMNAIAGGLTGVKAKIDSDILYTKSIELIISQMSKDRSSQETIIIAKLNAKPIAKLNAKPGYTSMYEAANDLYVYARAGSWTHALMQIQTDNNAQTAACQAELKNAQITNANATDGAAPTTSTQSGQSTGNVKCPQSGDATATDTPVKAATKAPTASEATDSDTIKKAQAALNKQGYALKVDGKRGRQTTKALGDLQNSHAIATAPGYKGTLTPETLKALNIQ